MFTYTYEEIIKEWEEAGFIRFDEEIKHFIYTDVGIETLKTDQRYLYNPDIQATIELDSRLNALHKPGAMAELLTKIRKEGFVEGFHEGVEELVTKKQTQLNSLNSLQVQMGYSPHLIRPNVVNFGVF